MQVLLNQLVYFGFFQSLLLLFVFLFSPKKRRHINGYMAFLILTLFIGLTGKVLHSSGVWNENFRLILFSEFSALLFGPTIYLFVRSKLKRRPYSHEDLVHYLPGVAYSVFITLYFIIPSDAIFHERINSGEVTRVVYACHAVGLGVNLTYWFLGWKTFQDFSKEMKNEISYELHMHFINNFLISTGVCLLIWGILYLTSIFGINMIERNARPYIWIILTFIILFITYYGMLYPQVLRNLPDMKSQKYAQSKFSIEDLDKLKEQLDALMLSKKPYLNSKLLKIELAQMLGVNNPELARLLNESIGMNFFEYVNYYRIKEFVSLAKTEKAEQLTFFGLAQEVGFNSKTTFNKAFKQLMGTSPSNYFNKKL